MILLRKCGEDELHDFDKHGNNFHPFIKFTLESSNKEITFLRNSFPAASALGWRVFAPTSNNTKQNYPVLPNASLAP